MDHDAVANSPASVVDFYSRIGRFFEVWARLTDSRARARVLTLCAVKDGEVVLDVGSGTGSQLIALAQRNPSGRTVGVDLADGMLSESARRVRSVGVKGAEVHRADARNLPFADGSVDLVTSSYLLDILPYSEIQQALKEFRRVLRPGGRLVACHVTPAERKSHRLPELLYGSKIPLTSNCRGICLRPALEDLGFDEVHREYSAQMLLPSEIIHARRP